MQGQTAFLAERALATDRAGIDSTDPDQASRHLARLYSPHRLTLPGRADGFAMRLRRRRLGNVGLASLAFGAETQLEQQPVGGFVLVTAQWAGQTWLRVGGQAYQGGPGLVVVDGADRPVIKRFSADSQRIHVRIDRPALIRLAATLDHRDGGLDFAPVMTERSLARRRWWLALELLLARVSEPGEAGPWLPALEENLLLTLLADHDHPAPAPMPAAIRRAETYLRAHGAEPLTLAQIAAAAGISIRSLTAGFRDQFGCSPMQYLRSLRLTAVRQALLAGEEGKRITDIALDHGFGHFGRFAGLYRRQYGETPSQTLRGRAEDHP